MCQFRIPSTFIRVSDRRRAEGALLATVSRTLNEANSAVRHRKCAYGEGPKAPNLDRHRKELSAVLWNCIKSTQMLDNRNICTQKCRVHRSLAPIGTVDIVRIDS